jgi:uncharacterized protein (DUF1919 family)
MSVTPEFIEPEKRYVHPAIEQNYPVMKLDDVVIDWIHEHSQKRVMKKFEGRKEMSKDLPRIFMWSASEFMNFHSDEERAEIIKRFLAIDGNKIFLTERQSEVTYNVFYIREWEGQRQDNRTQWGTLAWNNRVETVTKIHPLIKCINIKTLLY